MKTVLTVILIGLAPHADPTLLWMTTIEGSLRLEGIVPETIIAKDRLFPCVEITMTEMAMDGALPLGLEWKTTRLRVVPTTTPMMPGLPLLRAIMMTLTWRRGPMVVLVLLAVTTLRMTAPVTGNAVASFFQLWMLLQMIYYSNTRHVSY